VCRPEPSPEFGRGEGTEGRVPLSVCRKGRKYAVATWYRTRRSKTQSIAVAGFDQTHQTGPSPPCCYCCHCCCWPNTTNPVPAAVPVSPERGLSGLRCGHELGPAEKASYFRGLFVGPNAPAQKQRNSAIFINKSTSCVHHTDQKNDVHVYFQGISRMEGVN